MSVLAVKETMLYCPKCQQTYQDGTQRFCTNEGSRLLPAPSSGKSANQTNGVFTTLLGRVAPTDEIDKKLSSAPRFAKSESLPPNFIPPPKPRVFKTEQELKDEVQPQKPLPRIIKPSEIPTSQAQLGNRQINPMDRPALTWANPNVLLGQTVKGRYLVVEKLSEDESDIAYLAQDKLAADKKVVVRVLMDEEVDDDFTNQIFAEERVSLSLINHPNIARILDSGELLEGKPFIISEYVEGKSVKEMLKQTGQFNSLRAARIIRQAAYALSEVHQNGVLHRNLKPENIILTVSETGNEQVKLTNFGVSKGNNRNLEYKSPEQVEGNLATYASDIYSLAAIAYQMLTNRLPFYASASEDLSKAQQAGVKLRPTNLRLDVPPAVDTILEKALAFNPSERYPKARDFGDAFFNALAATASWENNNAADEIEIISDQSKTEPAKTAESATVLVVPKAEKETPKIETSPTVSDIRISPSVAALDKDLETSNVKATEDLAWEKRSPELPKTASASRTWLAIFGLAILFVGIWAMWQYVLNRPSETVFIEPPTQTTEIAEPLPQNPSLLEEIESPPLPRTISQPPNSVYFQNKKEDLKGDTAKNFLGFSLYYPKDWKQNDAKGKFLDISNDAPSGTPIEQMLVSYYDSKGTFNADAANFPSLVKETNATLKKIVPNYEMVSAGKKTVNNGWQAYEVKFKGAGKTKNGETITLWGRRLFIPAGLRGMKNGYVITMLATSLSPDVKTIDDVGVKGELANILETFEPNRNF